MSDEIKKEQSRPNGGGEHPAGEHGRSHRGSRGGRRRGGRGGQRRDKTEPQNAETAAEGKPMPADALEKTEKKESGEQGERSRSRGNRGGRGRGNQRRGGRGTNAPQAAPEAPAEDNEMISEVSPSEEEEMIISEIPDEPAAPPEPENPVEVIGVRFKTAGKVYYFAPGEVKAEKNGHVIVETARGTEFGEVAVPNRIVDESQIVPPLRPVLRAATEADIAHNAENKLKEKDAFRICQEKIAEHKLDMKLVDVEYTFDNNKLLFYFTSEGRVDFRELVKHLASIFHTRIELRQIGIRDEAKLMGGLGICGRPLCCASFLSDFVQVSIKMAKEQNLSLNSSKISGVCGRLMCCLRYESETYEEEIRRSPSTDAIVRTPDGTGVVTEVNPLAGTVRVRFPENTPPPKLYHRDEVKVIGRAGKGGRPDEIHEES